MKKKKNETDLVIAEVIRLFGNRCFFFSFQTTGKTDASFNSLLFTEKKQKTISDYVCVLAEREIIIATDTIFYTFFFKWLLLDSREYEVKIFVITLIYLG